MRIAPFLLALLLLLICPAARAQQPDSVKGKIYAAVLRDAVALIGDDPRVKRRFMVVVPFTKAGMVNKATPSMAAMMRPPRLKRSDTESADSPANGKASLQQPPVYVEDRPPKEALHEWVRADTSLANMGRRFDALEPHAQVVAGPIVVSGFTVMPEGPDYLMSDKRRNWASFCRKNKYSFGVYELSDVAFSNDGRYATLYLGTHQAGQYIFLEKTAMGWQTRLRLTLWMKLGSAG